LPETPLQREVQNKVDNDISAYTDSSPLSVQDEREFSRFVKDATESAANGIADDAGKDTAARVADDTWSGERPSAETIKTNLALGIGSAVKDYFTGKPIDAALPPENDTETGMLNSLEKGLSKALDYTPTPAAMIEKMQAVKERLTDAFKYPWEEFEKHFRSFGKGDSN
jgi:hypothetical protein